MTPATLVCGLFCAGAVAWAQSAPARAPLPCDTQAQAKSGSLYRIATPLILYVNCDNLFTEFTSTANLYAVDSAGKASQTAVPAQVGLFLPPGNQDSPWLRITLPATSPMQGGMSYRLIVAEDGVATIRQGGQIKNGPFNPGSLDISTAPSGTIAPSYRLRYQGARFRVTSNIALCGVQRNSASFYELGLLNQKIFHQSTTWTEPRSAPQCLPGSLYPAMPVPDGPAEYGTVEVDLVESHLRQASVTIQITGIHDIFGQELALKSDVSLGGVPKTKDASQWYFQFSHQAGPGSLPAWISDVKLAPQIGHPVLEGFFWTPSLNMDIGSGSVGTTKANDTINASLGLTRLFRFDERGLEAVRFTPALTFETNREFNQRNIVSDVDFAFSITGLSATRTERSWAIYNKLKDPKPKFSAQMASFGAGLQFFLGSEIGHDILAEKVTASKSTESVMVPPYSIARLRPRMTGFLEYKRMSLSLTAATRYLFLTEWVTRQSTNGKSIRLDPVSGFRPYGEAGIKFTLDQSGHIALNSTYKLGSQPPTFQYVNSVQSGVLFIY